MSLWRESGGTDLVVSICIYAKGGGAERGNGSIESIELRDLKH